MSGPPEGPVLPDNRVALTGLVESLLNRSSLLVGVGREDRGDDAFGVALIRALHGRTSLRLLEAGPAPENFLGRIVSLQPERVIFADAADLGGPAGAVAILLPEDAHSPSTHKPSLKLLRDFLTYHIAARCALLAVQPERMSGSGLSGPVSEAVSALADIIASLYPSEAANESEGSQPGAAR